MQQCCIQHCCIQHSVQNFYATCREMLQATFNKMADSTETVGACAVIVAILAKRRRRRRRKRTLWTREWIRNRQKFGVYHQLLQELRLTDVSSYRNFLRMDISSFEELLRLTGPTITYKDTNMRQAISPSERLALTLRFLATGKC